MGASKGGRLYIVEPRVPRERCILAGWTIAILGALALWELVHYIYPREVPGVVETLLFLYHEGGARTLYNTLLTIARSFLGFLIGFLVSLALGLLYTIGGVLREAVRAMNTILQSVSVLIWIIILVMMFGVRSPLPPILVAALVSLPIILAAVVAGLDSSSRKLAELAAMLGASRLQYYRDFLLPSLAPSLAGATRSALGAALRISVVAEAFGSNGGIGYMIANYYNLYEPRGVFAWGLVLVAVMIALDKLVLEPLEKRAARWSIEA